MNAPLCFFCDEANYDQAGVAALSYDPSFLEVEDHQFQASLSYTVRLYPKQNSSANNHWPWSLSSCRKQAVANETSSAQMRHGVLPFLNSYNVFFFFEIMFVGSSESL